MRIAFFSTMAGLPWGGSEELWCRAASVLLERGHQVSFNSIKWPTIATPLQELANRGAVAVYRSRRRLGRTLTRILQELKLTRLKYRSWLQQQRPELVVISFSCHTDDPQIAITCQAMGIPYAIVLQAAGPHHWLDPRSLDDFRAAYLNARQCYFVSEENRETIESNLAAQLPRYEIVDNPFSVSADAVPAWPEATHPWKLACVARVHFITKSQDLIVRVMRQPKWRTRPLHIALWGADHGNLNQLRRMLDIHGLHRQISYGGVSHNIAQLWSEHHALLLPSRAEGNALSLIEAMLCGRMPITTNVGRAGELIDDGQNGFIAPAATAQLLDEVLERAWQHRNDWQRMGQLAAQAIRNRHSLRPAEDFADRLESTANEQANPRRLAA